MIGWDMQPNQKKEPLALDRLFASYSS